MSWLEQTYRPYGTKEWKIVQDLRSLLDLIMNYDENDVIISIFLGCKE